MIGLARCKGEKSRNDDLSEQVGWALRLESRAHCMKGRITLGVDLLRYQNDKL